MVSPFGFSHFHFRVGFFFDTLFLIWSKNFHVLKVFDNVTYNMYGIQKAHSCSAIHLTKIAYIQQVTGKFGQRVLDLKPSIHNAVP